MKLVLSKTNRIEMFDTCSVSVECFAAEYDSIVALHILVIQSCRLIVEHKAMNGEHRPLVKDDPVEFEK